MLNNYNEIKERFYKVVNTNIENIKNDCNIDMFKYAFKKHGEYLREENKKIKNNELEPRLKLLHLLNRDLTKLFKKYLKQAIKTNVFNDIELKNDCDKLLNDFKEEYLKNYK